MTKKIILLICIISSNEVFLQVSSNSVISSISTVYERIRESIDTLNNVTRVRTTAELQAKGNEFATLDFIGLVQQYEGYEAEEYDVQTEDGYILKLHRIISSPHSPKAENKPVVYIQHGILASSDDFVNLGPSSDLGFTIADAGYDVWLGNTRGNFYSLHHIKYSPASTNYDFWKFNLDDIGLKDTPTFIDAVLAKTNKTKLIYIGHSLGTMMNYIFLSSKPEYNDKISLSISLAPMAYFVKPYTLFFKSLLMLRTFIPLFRGLRIYEIPPVSKFVIFFAKTVCTNFIGKYLCGLMASSTLAFENINLNKISSIYTVAVNGASLEVFTHIAQLASSEKFRKFDFGQRLNREKYNSSDPPEYDLSKITAPQAIFYADRDPFVNPKAAEKDKNQLPNVVAFEKVPESYKHQDFISAKNARTEYYYKILNLLKNFSY